MLFSKVGVYKAETEDAFIVELGHEAEDTTHAIHTSSPLQIEEVKYLLRHVELTDNEIEKVLKSAEDRKTSARELHRSASA